eukprot:GDKH01013870.1.p4 GENE.GDKH01013870.1~~GDKH01013870.1.p4  ORF type:complete len:51 (-),score=2.01 GDKH01013870.1:35-187(-)
MRGIFCVCGLALLSGLGVEAVTNGVVYGWIAGTSVLWAVPHPISPDESRE